ncbi:MAG: hypothetical protein AAF721_25905 [Myxococcota bacterium]
MAAAGCGTERIVHGSGGDAAGCERQLDGTVEAPWAVLPGSVLRIQGQPASPDDGGAWEVVLEGSYAGSSVQARWPATVVEGPQSPGHSAHSLEVRLDAVLLGQLGPASTGVFDGDATVAFVGDDGEVALGSPAPLGLNIVVSLQPELLSVIPGEPLYVNDVVQLGGDGFLGGGEGTTRATIEGCFTAQGTTSCEPVAPLDVAVTLVEPSDRTRGGFPWIPELSGLGVGRFEGSVAVRNEHAGGTVSTSEALPLSLEVTAAPDLAVGTGGSLGQTIDVSGGGFVGQPEGATIVRLDGEYVPDGGATTIVASLDLSPEFVDGRTLRYVVNEADAFGQLIDPRRQPGAFEGEARALRSLGGVAVEGPPSPVSFRIEPLKQVVYVKFTGAASQTLRTFGLEGIEPAFRARVVEVLRRDYEGINVEFRVDPPEDFVLFTTIEIAGADPNGLGLLGHDNTAGKDRNNERLSDYIGGNNAQTQEDGFPGFGGVFLESMWSAFSLRPPGGSEVSEGAAPLFDAVFDPFRPDLGAAAFSACELEETPLPSVESEDCPAPATDRALQAACAARVLGNLAGGTASHTLAHALGLADPNGERFHNLGDRPNRLMDVGRPFEERAELDGQGPSRFCLESYDHLRALMPSDAPPPAVERVSCDG